MSYRIKNWTRHQHYKDRAPQWVKLYRDLLDNLDWHQLKGDDAKGLVLLWLLASEDEKLEGNLPSLDRIAFRLRITEQDASKMLARLSNWVEQPASNVLADCKQDASLEERRGELDTKRQSRASARVVSVERPEQIPETLWSGWLAIRKAKRAPLTEAALRMVRDEAAKANWTLEAALRECVLRGWQGFKAEWVAKAASVGATPPPLNKFAKPVTHMPNMPLGAPSCGCNDCVGYREKRMVTA